MKKATKRWVEKHWGIRCKEFEWGCPLCQAWKAYDYLFATWDDEHDGQK